MTADVSSFSERMSGIHPGKIAPFRRFTMKKMGDMLLRRDAFSEIVMGNTAIVRAMVEAGTRVVSSYPGSPTPEIASAIQSIPKDDRPFYFEFSTNEKVATELAYGAAVNGHLSTVFFKASVSM
jgi:indolepyruvate ferredoxin oxidoreductase alpha subunit